MEKVTQGTSVAFPSNPGDAIIVYASIYGRDTVASVTDSVGDAFHQLVNATMAFGSSGAYNGLSVWVASNAAGSSSVTLTVTLHPRYWNSLNASAITFVDVTGVAYQPLDAVGAAANSSGLVNQQSTTPSSSVEANTTDLVLGGVGARNYDDLIATGGDARVTEQVGVLSSASTDAMTTAVFQETQGPASGPEWLNSSLNKSSAWIAESLALRGGGPPPPSEFWILLTESGLSTGTSWSVSVGPGNATAIAPGGIRLAEPNGTYPFLVSGVSGYVAARPSGSFTVNGTAVNMTFVFSPLFPITFVPNGLPSGTSWSIAMGNETLSAVSPSELTFQRTDGMYAFTPATSGFVAAPGLGAIEVNNSPVTSVVDFSGAGAGYAVVFTPAGSPLPPGQTWSVSLGNHATSAPGGTAIEFVETNGSYSYSVGTSSGLLPNPSTGTVKVNGKTVSQTINFNLPKGSPNALFKITFVEQGLANNTTWSVTVAGKSFQATTPAPVNASLQNGSQSYQVKSITGYVGFPQKGTVDLVGRAVTVPITFDNGTDVRFTSSGLPSATPWSVVLHGAERSVWQSNQVDFGMAAGTYAYSIPPVPGFSAKPSSGSVTVGASTVNTGIRFSALSSPQYNVSLSAQGLPVGTNWSASVGTAGGVASSPAPVVLSLAGGTYFYSVSSVSGFVATVPTGGFQVDKLPVNSTVTFSVGSQVTPWPVTFREKGLTGGSTWSISLGGAAGRATTPSAIGFSAPNGTESFVVAVPAGYTADVVAGTVAVNGSGITVTVSFTADIQHVVVIVLENNELSSILANGPYENYLWNRYGHASNFFGTCHQSKPEYAAMTSGRSFTCSGFPVESVTNLADLLEQRSLSWSGYFESMPSACGLTSLGAYTTYHNPFIDYLDIVNNASRCDGHVVNSASFNASVASGSLPTVSFYIPNMVDDCHNSTIASCDSWLKGFLAPMLNSTNATVQGLVSHTAFFIVYDEGSTNAGYSVPGIVSSYCKNLTGQSLSVCGGHTYLAVVSPYSDATIVTADATDYNLESTIEWLFGLGSDGGYDGTAGFPSMNGLFSFG